jgi:hypothetical protein
VIGIIVLLLIGKFGGKFIDLIRKFKGDLAKKAAGEGDLR